MAVIHITERALQEVGDIEQYSIEEWGLQVSNDYIDSIEQALQRIAQSPRLLLTRPELSKKLKFYPVRSHILVFTVINKVIYFVTIKHGSMDLLNRIAELEPTLAHEVALLHDKARR